MLKCIARFNHYGKQSKMINKQLTGDECSRYLQIEDWNHIIICLMITESRKEYIIKLHTELLKVKYESIETEQIIEMLSNIITYFIGGSEYKVMQAKIRVSNFFKGYIAKDWYSNSNTMEYYRLNKILVKESILFY